MQAEVSVVCALVRGQPAQPPASGSASLTAESAPSELLAWERSRVGERRLSRFHPQGFGPGVGAPRIRTRPLRRGWGLRPVLEGGESGAGSRELSLRRGAASPREPGQEGEHRAARGPPWGRSSARPIWFFTPGC